VERAFQVATVLGLVTESGGASGGAYVPASPYRYYFGEATEARRIDLLRLALEAFPPYRFFKQRIGLHGDVLRAARETRFKFDYANHEMEIRETL
jgi:hypothetical protein